MSQRHLYQPTPAWRTAGKNWDLGALFMTGRHDSIKQGVSSPQQALLIIQGEGPWHLLSFRDFLRFTKTNAYIAIAVADYYSYAESHVSTAFNSLSYTSDINDSFF